MKTNEYKAITEELSYLRKEIEKMNSEKPVQIDYHYHFTIDYSNFLEYMNDVFNKSE